MLLDRYFEKLASEKTRRRPKAILPLSPPKFAAGLKQVLGRSATKPSLVFSRREGGPKRAAQPAPSRRQMILDDYLTNKIQEETGGIKQHSEQMAKPAPFKRIRMILDGYLENFDFVKGASKRPPKRAASPTPFRRISTILDGYLDNLFEKQAGLGWFIRNRALIPQY
ncbi:MAG: hypothetical protein LBC63_08315 [Holophagales bacterium]|jgi:hypothetical protein|nr:hypothetical protein [Holophagales bacterium]